LKWVGGGEMEGGKGVGSECWWGVGELEGVVKEGVGGCGVGLDHGMYIKTYVGFI